MNVSYINSDIIPNTSSYSVMASSVPCKAGSEGIILRGSVRTEHFCMTALCVFFTGRTQYDDTLQEDIIQ